MRQKGRRARRPSRRVLVSFHFKGKNEKSTGTFNLHLEAYYAYYAFLHFAYAAAQSTMRNGYYLRPKLALSFRTYFFILF